jgi:hypothetical protein
MISEERKNHLYKSCGMYCSEGRDFVDALNISEVRQDALRAENERLKKERDEMARSVEVYRRAGERQRDLAADHLKDLIASEAHRAKLVEALKWIAAGIGGYVWRS